MKLARLESFVRCLVIVIGLLALGSSAAWAQNATTGAISGTITDSSGAVIPGATVTATNMQSGAVSKASTQRNGSYIVPLLQPGPYVVMVEHAGFASAKQAPVDVAVAGNIALNFKLTVGQASQTVEVTGQAPLLEPENPNTTTTLDTKAIEDLPNPGNDLTFMAQTIPGAVLTKGATGQAYIAALYNGLPNTGVNFSIDGAGFVNTFLGINQSGATNLALGVNAIQEVSSNTNSYSLDQGGGEAGQVDYVSKHGGNDIHGNLSYQWNGRVLNAYDTFIEAKPVTPTSPLPAKPFDSVNNWAASVGGPVMHNKLFYFFDDEGAHIQLPVVTTTTLPTPAYIAYAGTQMALGGCETSINYFVSTGAAPATGNCAVNGATQPGVSSGKNGNYLYLPAATGANAPGGVNELPFQQKEVGLYQNITGGNGVQLTPVSQLGCNLLANGSVDPSFNPQVAAGQKKGDANLLPSDTGCTNQALFTGTNTSWENYFESRVDFNPSQVDNFWLSYVNDRGLQATQRSPINPIFNETSFHPYESLTGDWTRVVSPAMVNALILSTSWLKAPFVFDPSEAAIQPIAFATPWATLGSASIPQGRDVTNWGITDNLNYTHGAHQFKFGENFARTLTTDLDLKGSATPSVTASSFADFDYGVATAATENFPISTDQPVRQFSLEFYGQDTWKLTNKFTLIYGLRTTTQSNPKDPQGYIGNPTDFELMQHSLAVSPATVIFPSDQLYNSVPAVQWQPRAAFSYQPRENTIIRGGYGLFDEVLATSVIDSMMKNPPFDPQFIGGFGSNNLGAIPPRQGPNGCGFGINSGGPLCGDYYDPSQTNSAVAAAALANAGFQKAFVAQALSCAAYSTVQPAGTCIPVANLTIMPQSGLNAPYAEEWNFGVEQQLGRNSAVKLSYVGNRSLHNTYTVDPNSYETVCSGCFAPFTYSATGVAGSPNPRFGTVSQTRFNGYSTYNAMQANWTERNYHGLTLDLNYAWAHGLSTNTPYNDISSLAYTYRDTAGLPTHTLSASYSYALPWHTGNHFLGEVVDGWQISGATFSQSGDPLFVTGPSQGSSILANASGPTTTAYVVGGVSPYSKGLPVAGTTTAGTYQWLNPKAFVSAFDVQTGKCIDPATLTDAAANNPAVCQFPATEAATYWGPRFNWTNFFLTKTFTVTERIHFRFDAQAYNLFNHPNYAQPGTTAPTPGQASTFTNFGAITKLANPSDGLLGNGLGGADSAPRMIAFQGKIIF